MIVLPCDMNGINPEKLLMENYQTVEDYADLHAITPQGVRKAIKERRLKAFKFGHQWVIQRGSEIKRNL